MAKAVEGNKVRVRYQVKMQDGTVCDTSDLEFTIGNREVIPGLEEAVIGMEPGETRSGRIPRQKAFGEWRSDLQFDLPRSSPVNLSVYDVTGRLIRVLVGGEVLRSSRAGILVGRTAGSVSDSS